MTLRWFRLLLPLCLILLLGAPLFAQQPTPEPLPLPEAVFGGTGVVARYPDGWVAYEDESGTLFLATDFDIYSEDNLPDAGTAYMAVRVRQFSDVPRIPPNEDSTVAAARLVPRLSDARDAYRAAPAGLLRYRAGELSAPFLQNNRHYILFVDESRLAEVWVGAAPGQFAALEPTFRRMADALVFTNSRPPDVRRAGFGRLYHPRGFGYPRARVYDSLNGNLELDLPFAWQLSEPSWNDMTITNRGSSTTALLPGEFVAQGTFGRIPEDAVVTPLSLLYGSLPSEGQRVLSVDTFTWNGVEMARAVLSDGRFVLTRLVLEPPIPPEELEQPAETVEGEDGEQAPPPEPREPQLTHYFTLRVRHFPGTLDNFEPALFEFAASARLINEQFFPFDTRDYPNLDVEQLAPRRFISARADLTTHIPGGWYALEQNDSIALRSSGTPLDVIEEDNSEEALLNNALIGEVMLVLSIRPPSFLTNNGITENTRFHEIPYVVNGPSVEQVTVVTFAGQQAVSYAVGFGRYTVLLIRDDGSVVRARVESDVERYYEIDLPRVLAIMARTAPTPLGNEGGGGVPSLDATFTAGSQRVQFDVPRNWFTSETPDAAVSSALIGIPARSDVPLRGDPASPAFQQNADALVTITYLEPPTFAVVDEEGNVDVFAQPLENYLANTIGENGILPQRLTIAGYNALSRLKNGSGHILIQRNDGSIVQVYVQNLTGNPTNNEYSFGYESALFAVLNTLRYPPVDATEPTELFVDRGRGYAVQYPYDWNVRQQEFTFTQGEGEAATTVTERVTYFANVLDFDPAAIAPGQARIGVQVEPAAILRNVSRGTPDYGVRIGEVVNGSTARGSVYRDGAVFTIATETPFRRIVITLETTPQDFERFYPTAVKIVQSLQLTTVAPPPDATSDDANTEVTGTG